MPKRDEPSRFTNNETRGASIASGYQQASSRITPEYLKRNLAVWKQYGLPQDLTKLANMSDSQREHEAAKAVLAKFKGTKTPTPPSGGGGGTNNPPSGGGGGVTRPPTGGGGSKPQPRPQPKPKPKGGGTWVRKPGGGWKHVSNAGGGKAPVKKPTGGTGGTSKPKPGGAGSGSAPKPKPKPDTPIITRPPVGGTGPIKS